ncbi:hypothetical protein Ae168Ps1_4899 [Pseudonocardia sp. Ae168_Ps1]|uniref:hypothetical protein n=1 Tax=unclassified Pseudonocardia TaxID=2619320 RepID=UPI0001FFF08D|nr:MULTISPECIES: hypothetical protein [unclassified Pseudonocardia]ALE75380.1 hypothetical protein FRP1_25255 [Pseudonocardia sp. EC080625-04]ALL74743.1 hypothetical protein AD006_04435 [Pseudonocardia sp. EC080610-09]ALL81766.1 hypothetical protein AD017_12255 [Pseudonocardia sp. EC080619-01]OLL76483.1 hypothetical protein Ae150APs1_4861 [Pseudonocardia sp. Ae150A_Ps1]OLL82493.1 hypothetical protein Ae168Ps1_4899 [Pseudonocardia sp. Ae168_Ps1]
MTPTVYRFRIDGHLSEQAAEEFCDMRIEEARASTVLEGTVVDESHLHGIIASMRVLGLTVVSVRPVVR